MTLLACSQCWFSITQIVSFTVVFSGSILYCIKDFVMKRKREKALDELTKQAQDLDMGY